MEPPHCAWKRRAEIVKSTYRIFDGAGRGPPRSAPMKKTEVLLVVPQQPASADILKISTGITQPLGLGYIAAVLERAGTEVALLDNSVERLTPDEFKDMVRAREPRLLGLSVCSSSHNTALALARLAKEALPGLTVAVGGIHPSALPGKMLEDPAVDFVIIGEGESTLPELLAALRSGSDPAAVPGLAFRSHGRITETAPRPLIEDLDSLPFPAWHLMRMDRYTLPAQRRLTSAPAAGVITSRGCPHACNFCSHNSVFRGRVRFRSPESVVAELTELQRSHGVGEVLFWDDSFLLRPDRATEICRLIVERGLKLTWSCSSRADQFTLALARQLRAAGCRLVSFGIESGSETIRRSLNKGVTREQAFEAVRVCREAGLLSFCSFMLGSPGETKATAAETIRMACDLDPDFAICCLFSPMPGSAFFDRLVAQGKLDPAAVDWDRYINLLSNLPPAVTAGELPAQTLVRLQKKFFLKFYLRPGYLLRRLRLMRTPVQLRENLRGLLALLRFQGRRFPGGKT